MKKILNILMLFSILFSMFSINANAEETKKGMVVTADGNGSNLRNGPGASYTRVGGLDDGKIFSIIAEEATNDGSNSCSGGIWYKIVYSSDNAYICKSLTKLVETPVTPDYDFEKEIAKFPESYRPFLRQLHQTYPNAIFVPVEATNSKPNTASLGKYFMDWDTALYNESVYLGKNLLWDSNGSRDGLKNLDSYSYDTNSFYNKYSGGGVNWYAPSQKIIAYYLDPRNFLNEQRVFMFESLSYNASMYSTSGVEGILSGSYMYNNLVDGGAGNKKFSETIMDAAAYSNVSPYFLASRILQEVGTTRSDLVKGTYPSYPQFNGYYNYYNIGAGGTNVVFNGLTYAYNQGWNSEYKAIVNGSSWIGSNYINGGQDTNYFQKWDVKCGSKNSCYSYQYMQNIEAPYSEALNTYKAYKKVMGNSMYEMAFVFNIPVYDKMPEKTDYPSEKSPINFLNSLVVNGSSIANFNGSTSEYNLTVPAGTTNVNIEAVATAANKGATVSGIGNVAINSEKQDVKVTVTAANGDKRTYTIHVTRLQAGESTITLEETLKNITGATIKENYISGLTSIDTIRSAVSKANPNALVIVKNSAGNVINSGNLATGYKISITVVNETKEFEFILFGDTNGDGDITILDLLRVQKQLLSSLNLSGAQFKSCDVNKDGSVDILDLLLVQKHLLGSKYIIQ